MCLKRKNCPICKKYYNEPPALSRKDNKTEICSNCGTIEALESFKKYNYRLIFKEEGDVIKNVNRKSKQRRNEKRSNRKTKNVRCI